MNNNPTSSFKKGNQFGKGRNQGTYQNNQMVLQHIGIERALSLLDLHLESAHASEDARKHILDKIFPNIKPVGRLTPLELPSNIKSSNELLTAQQAVMQHIAAGQITLDEGEKYFNLLEMQRKTIESIEMTEVVQAMDKRMKEAGI